MLLHRQITAESLRGRSAREALAEAAAHGANILPALRAVLYAEALTSLPPAHTLELSAEVNALCLALQQVVRRRAGWLYFAPCAASLPVTVPRALLAAAVLQSARGALLAGTRAVIVSECCRSAAVLTLRAPAPLPEYADTALLLRRLGALCEGTSVLTPPHAPFAAAVRLPLCPALPMREAPRAEDFLCDRYSAVYAFSEGFCVLPN